MRLYRRLGYAPISSRSAVEVTRDWAVGPYRFESCTLVELRKFLGGQPAPEPGVTLNSEDRPGPAPSPASELS
jgi:hypothetical protein